MHIFSMKSTILREKSHGKYSKGSFRFVPVMYLEAALKIIDEMLNQPLMK